MDIEIKENSQEFYTKSELPFDSVFAGSEGQDSGLAIHIKQSTLRKIEDYLSGDKSNELGGVLVGDVCETEEGARYIKIDNMILAMHASSSLSRLTFTHETWDYINKVLEEEHPGKKIVGWFHSHPGHTVFLSGHDLFIHENFFNLPYMVAYVFDPTIKERGFFKWQEGEIVKAGGFYIFDNAGGEKIHEILNNVEPEEEHAEPLVNRKIRSGRIDVLKSIMVAIGIFTLLLTIILSYNFIELNKKIQQINDLREEVSALKDKIDGITANNMPEKRDLSLSVKGANTIAKKDTPVVTQKEVVALKTPDKDTVRSQHENVPVTEQKKPPEQNQKQLTSGESKKYTVKKGDTLEKIAISVYGSRDGIEHIMRINNIQDKASIKAGQVLDIPIKN